ncbi:hypothetical protein SNE40_019629 [Patella caerulea]|uniref:Uncharacterized protein n=2 Tax=Patella caerulea TaxID=87958 RepID=A0AAN8JAV8_PATCE
MAGEISRLVVFGCLFQGVMAVEEGLTGLIIAGVVAGGLLIVALISISIYCFVRRRNDEDEKDSLDIVVPSNGAVPRYQRFPMTMKFRSHGPAARPRPPVTFYTVRSPREPQQLMPVGMPFMYEPRGPVMYLDEKGIGSLRSTTKDRAKNHRSFKANGHIADSLKIKELQSAEERIDFDSSEDENGNRVKSRREGDRSRSKSRDRKYERNPDRKNGNHRYKGSKDDLRARSRSNSRNRSEENTIVAQPGDIILNPSNFETQPPPRPHSLTHSLHDEATFVPIVPANNSAFRSYSRNQNDDVDNQPLETPREDYLTPRSMTEMPSTIRDETPRDEYITPTADYRNNTGLVYPPKQDKSSNEPYISPRPPTPEFDAQSISDGQGVIRSTYSRPDVLQSTPRPPDMSSAPAPPPPPTIPDPSRPSYISAVHRPPTPVPGLITPVDDDISEYLNKPADNITDSPSISHVKKSPMPGVSPLHNAVIAEIKNRRQRPASDGSSIGRPPSRSSDGYDSDSASVPSRYLENRRPSAVQFTEQAPEIIPRDEPELDYEPGSLSAAFDSVMNHGVPDSSSVPVAPPPPPPPPPLR